MSYHQFAALYDEFMSHAPYDSWTQFTKEIIQKHGLDVKSILDLGCGTGEITIRLNELGFDIAGVDLSADMLAIASEKAINKKSAISFVHQDIRHLNGFQEIDVCISYCDVINYITDVNDVEQVFYNVFHSLSQNGAFIFDVHHLPYVEQHLMNHTFSDVTDQMAYIWDCEATDCKGEMHHYLTFFEEQDNGSYERFDEFHHQYVLSLAKYETLLKKVGFTKIAFYADFQLQNSNLGKNSERIFIIAEK